MPTQQNIQTCILNASYKLTTLVQANLALINRGGIPSNTDTLQFWRFNIIGLQYMYDFGLYTSVVTIGLYDRLASFIGIPSNATVDPNFQAPNITIIVEGGTVLPAIEFLIPAGSAWPFPYPYVLDGQPDVSYLISDGAGGLTGNGTSGMWFDLSGGVMSIYGNNSGSNTFLEDTYVKIQP